MIAHAAIGLEERTATELEYDARSLPDPALCERALYQYVQRNRVASLPLLRERISEEDDTDLRVSVLWALEWLNTEECKAIGRELFGDCCHRVREWARVFAWEMGWTDEDYRQACEFRHYEGRTFDETIYLHITCKVYVRMSPANNLWVVFFVSPQMFKRVFGQALACRRMGDARDDEVVVAKTLSGLKTDGSEHYEAFLFKGFTDRSQSLQGNFYFETQTERPIFLTGKAADSSKGIIDKVVVAFAREGQWFLNENPNVRAKHAIEYVRGLFRGWSYVNLDKMENVGGEFFPRVILYFRLYITPWRDRGKKPLLRADSKARWWIGMEMRLST